MRGIRLMLVFSLLVSGFVLAEESNSDDAGPADAEANEDAVEDAPAVDDVNAADDDTNAADADRVDEAASEAAEPVESNDESPLAPQDAKSDVESESEMKPPAALGAEGEEPAEPEVVASDEDVQQVVVEPEEPQAKQEEQTEQEQAEVEPEEQVEEKEQPQQPRQPGTGSLTLDISDSVPRPGTNVTITCTLKGIPEGSLVQFKKAVIHDLKELAFEPISSLKILEIPYRNIPRYSISTYTDGDDKIYALHIADVQYVDSGDYACFVTDFNEMYALKLMEVYQVPQEIFFVGYNDSDVIDLDENDVMRPPMVCRAAYLMPHADMTLTIGKRDVTNDFLLTAELNVNCRQNIGDYAKTCPLNCNLNQTAISRGFKPVYTDDEQVLVCRAKMRPYDRDVVETSLVMNVQYSPKIVCKRAPWSARLGAEQVNISCVVYSNPPIGPYNRTWIVRRGARDETRLNFPVISDDFVVLESMVGDNPKIINTTLVINKVRLDLFRDYYLQANNELGPAETKLTLKQYTATIGRANHLAPGADVIGVIALFVTSFQLLRRHVMSEPGHCK